MTLDGTNTWLIAAPGVDVGGGGRPRAGRRRASAPGRRAAAAAGQRIAQILLTHGHADHRRGAAGSPR